MHDLRSSKHHIARVYVTIKLLCSKFRMIRPVEHLENRKSEPVTCLDLDIYFFLLSLENIGKLNCHLQSSVWFAANCRTGQNRPAERHLANRLDDYSD